MNMRFGKSGTDRDALTALMLSVLVLFAAMGIRMSFGAYVTSWENAFGATRSEISLISAVSFIIYGFTMPVLGGMVDRYGARIIFIVSMAIVGAGLIATSYAQSVWQLVILYGIVASIGFCGTSSLTASVAVMKWFPLRSALAVGVSSCGIAAGGMILAPLSVKLIHSVGWRPTMFWLGMGCLVVITALLWLFFKDAPDNLPKGGKPGETGRNSPSFTGTWAILLGIALGIPYFVCGFTDLGLFSTHFVPLSEGRGMSPEIVAIALAVDSGANLCGNILGGYLADRMSITLLLAGMYVWRALGIMFLIGAADPASLIVFTIINGSVEASTIAPTAALCSKLYGKGKMGKAFGWVSTAHQFGGASGAFLIGLLYGKSGNYTSGLALSVGLLFGAAALTLMVNKFAGKGRVSPGNA